MPDAPCSALILAAGRTDRMHSARSQPLHLLCGRPMVQYVVDALGSLNLDRIVMVVDDDGEQISKKMSETAADPRLVFTEAPSGCGSAQYALSGLGPFADDFGDEDLVIVAANTPLLTRSTMETFVAFHQASGAAGAVLAVPAHRDDSFGRIVAGKDPGTVQRVVTAVNRGDEPGLAAAGPICIRRSLLAPAIRRIRPDELTGLFDLSAVVEVLTTAGHQISSVELESAADVQPIDDRAQLAAAEAVIRDRTNLAWMRRGVTMVDPARTYVDATVRLAPDVTLFPGTMLQGTTVVGPGAEIGPDTRLADCAVGSGARVEKTMGRDAEVGEGAHVGPFAVLDAGAHVAAGAVTGPFYHATASD